MATSTIKQNTSNFFGNRSKHYYASLTAIDGDGGIVTTYLRNGTGNDAVVNSVHNTNSLDELSSAGNQQDIFGWFNAGGQFGWMLVISFGGMWIGKRAGSTTTTFTKIA